MVKRIREAATASDPSSCTLLASTGATTLIVGGTVSGGALGKDGVGTLTLSNAGNNYTGATTVLAGTLHREPAWLRVITTRGAGLIRMLCGRVAATIVAPLSIMPRGCATRRVARR